METDTGFHISISTGSALTMPLDLSKPSTADFDGVTASLLPITVSVPVNLIIACSIVSLLITCFSMKDPGATRTLPSSFERDAERSVIQDFLHADA
ncbi:hypothetical protein F5B20DRAFT_579369 [Whalleya microplaca]|nr:hypothetical protein F5B20DRAFT_579369 [Whalleya microplaca]